MKKILIGTMVLCLAFSSLYAQPTFTEPLTNPTVRSAGIESSARSRATADTMLSESDKITADKIHEINDVYFSGGYTRESVVTGYWAMPINSDMFIGFAGEYNMATYRVDAFDDPVGGGKITFDKEVVENSSFDMRAAFGFQDFGVSYQVFRNNLPKTTTEQKIVSLTGDILREETTIENGKEIWSHELGFAYHMPDNISLFAMLELQIKNADKKMSTILDKTRLITTDFDTETIKEENGNASIALSFSPSVRIPIDWWHMTKVETGLQLTFDVQNTGESSKETTLNSGKSIYGNVVEKTEIIKTEAEGAFSIGVFGKPTFEWMLLGDVISVVAEPQLNILYSHIKDDATGMYESTVTTTKDGESTTVVTPKTGVIISNKRIKTSFGTNVGFEVRPKDWFTFRTGLRYMFIWDTMNVVHDYSLSGGEKVNAFEYALSSSLQPELGFAFDIEDTFIIDIVLTSNSGIDLVQLDSYDIQLTCKF